MRYSVLAGGKRVRPALCFATAKALGQDPKKIMPIACAIELLHTFTLVHDDLPAMDNSDYRRGKLACHKKFDEATAILAGDALQALAFQILSVNPPVSKIIARALMAVVEGQVLDLASTGQRISSARLKKIHKLKTGALLVACVQAAAVWLGAKAKEVKSLTVYAKHLGLAFQIADDILDLTATQKELGKPVQADRRKGFPYYFGLAKARTLALGEKHQALAALNSFGPKAEGLRAIAEYVIIRKK